MTPERYSRLRDTLSRRQPDLTVVMDQVHKPHNVGAIIRTCDAVGVLDIHAVTDETIAGMRRTASGSRRWIGVRRHPDITDAVVSLRDAGFQILAAHFSLDARDFREMDYTRPSAVVMGAELDGVSPAAAGLADSHLRIPMHGMVESLNVSVAAALILYEAERQRSVAGMYDECRIEPEVIESRLFEWAYPRLARLCRERGVPYPSVGHGGDIIGAWRG